MLFAYLAVLISSAHARCACLATGGKCLYGNHEYTCDVPDDSTCSDKWKTYDDYGQFYGFESKQPCAGLKRGEGRTCFVEGCAGGTCMESAIEKLIYKLSDGNCYKPWESCKGCLSNHQDRRAFLPVSCPTMECALPGQPEGSSFDCRGRCSAGFSCHQASGQCRSNPNTPQASCVGTCARGYCCNKDKNRCDACGTESAVAGSSPEMYCWGTGGVWEGASRGCNYGGRADADVETAVAEDTFKCSEGVVAAGYGTVHRVSLEDCKKRMFASKQGFIYYPGSKHCQASVGAHQKNNGDWTYCLYSYDTSRWGWSHSEYSQAFTGASESTFSAVNVFAAFGLGVVLYGSFRHYVK